MKYIFFFFCLFSSCLSSQSIKDIKKRFDSYLNFNGSLSGTVIFEHNSIKMLSAGKPEFTIYDGEQIVLSEIFKIKSNTELINFYNWKSNRILTKQQIDSLKLIVNKNSEMPLLPVKGKPLSGKRIAIDPGHFSGNLKDSKVEQKFIEFIPESTSKLKDTIRFNEGFLTFQTAEILKKQLEEQGAVVMLSRPKQNHTAFNLTYQNWYNNQRKKTFDSLVKAKYFDSKKQAALLKLNKEKLFWDFFRDYELGERSRVINNFKPDVTVIIHYNVDEKNTDWKRPTDKNYTMTFIGGGMTSDNLSKSVTKVNFVRLLLTNQLNQSEKLASYTVNEFNNILNIPIAKKQDADYLKNSCLSTESKGVFCRNLALCRTINSPLVYGEALYQDNILECQQLNVATSDCNGVTVSTRICLTAQCYYNALVSYFLN